MSKSGHPWGTVWTLAVLTILSGCGKNDASSGNATGKAKPGYAIGRITQEAGGPITAQGAKVTIAIWGVSSKSGEEVNYSPKVNADGTYEQKLVDGTYHFGFAHLDVPFNNQHYMLDLEPVGTEAKNDRDSDKGIVQDFVWKLKGLRPGQDANENDHTQWYGASVSAVFQSYRNDLKKSVSRPPAGTKYVFTVTPQGNIIDGSAGKELTFTRDYDPLLGQLKTGNLPDIPIGIYTIKGEEVLPDGTKKPVLFQTQYPNYAASTTVKFAPGATTGAWPSNQSFTRQD